MRRGGAPPATARRSRTFIFARLPQGQKCKRISSGSQAAKRLQIHRNCIATRWRRHLYFCPSPARAKMQTNLQRVFPTPGYVLFLMPMPFPYFVRTSKQCLLLYPHHRQEGAPLGMILFAYFIQLGIFVSLLEFLVLPPGEAKHQNAIAKHGHPYALLV